MFDVIFRVQGESTAILLGVLFDRRPDAFSNLLADDSLCCAPGLELHAPRADDGVTMLATWRWGAIWLGIGTFGENSEICSRC